MFHQLALIAVPDFPLVEPGNELASMISDACRRAGIALNDGDVAVIAQKKPPERSPNGMSFGLFNPWCEQHKI